MTIDRRTLFQAGGVALMVGVLFAGAKALGGVLGIVYLVLTIDPVPAGDPLSNVMDMARSGQLAKAIEGIVTVVILALGSRWFLRGPRLLERWIDSGGEEREDR